MLVRRIFLIALSVLFTSRLLAALPASAQTVRDIAFPVEGPVTFYDDFGMSRSGGRAHEGNDLLGTKMQKLLSAVDGRVTYLVYPEADWGYAVVIRDNDGYTYHYLHVNNDTPGTDDGNGGPENAYAPGIYDGARVTRGQHIAWMGDSGNAENVGAHLHFEIRYDGTPINPYPSLIAAQQEGGFDPEAATAASPDFNVDRNIPTGVNPGCVSGSRVKSPTYKAVYFCGADGKRYVYPNDKTYYTWYANFSGVTTLTDAQLAALPLGGNVTYRPGVKMVKITTDPKVYAVDRGGTLRWIQTPEIAAAMYGPNWATMVDDVSDAFFINYKVGEPITRAL